MKQNANQGINDEDRWENGKHKTEWQEEDRMVGSKGKWYEQDKEDMWDGRKKINRNMNMQVEDKQVGTR